MFILKAENTEKASHNVKPRLPGKMCTLTSVVRSQHAIGTRSNKSTRVLSLGGFGAKEAH